MLALESVGGLAIVVMAKSPAAQERPPKPRNRQYLRSRGLTHARTSTRMLISASNEATPQPSSQSQVTPLPRANNSTT
jgi:hypothetical protein